MNQLDQIALVSKMRKALEPLSAADLGSRRQRDVAYSNSPAWSDLALMPEYKYRELDDAARYCEAMRRSVMKVLVAQAA